MRIEVLEGDDLAVPTAGRAPFDAEGRPHGRLSDGDRRLLAQTGEGLPEADRRRGLALAERRRRDRRDDDVTSLRPARQGFDGVEVHFGHVQPVVLEQAGRDPHLPGDLVNRPQLRVTGDLYGGGQRHLTGPLRRSGTSGASCLVQGLCHIISRPVYQLIR